MAPKPDLKAQKERKQKIFVGVGAVILVGVLAFELPGLLKHSSSSTAAPAATTTTADGTTTPAAGVVTPVAPSTPVNVSATRYSAKVAGVVLAPATTPDAVQGQLWSFSRFKAKDPFVQQVKDASSTASAPIAPGGTTPTTGGTSGGTTPPATTGGSGAPAPVAGAPAPVAPLAYATLLVNGRPQQLTLKQLFPKADPIFVLVKLVGKDARIGVAGGSFTAGNTILLELGKRVTLMNTTTGQRYVVKLVYVGDQPEKIAVFKGGKVATVAATRTSAP